VDQQGAQIAVPALGDPAQHGLASRGMLARNQPQIGTQLASIPEALLEQLAVLATHCVVQAARYNNMISGLQALAWCESETDARWIDETEYRARSQELERQLMDTMIKGLGKPLNFRAD
jgi:hypothetical protein